MVESPDVEPTDRPDATPYCTPDISSIAGRLVARRESPCFVPSAVKLDPELEAALARVPSLDPCDPVKARHNAHKLWYEATGGMMPTDDRVAFEDHLVATGANQHSVPIRLYRSVSAPSPHASIVFCHGGGFVMGSVETGHAICLRFAAEVGCAVVSVDYRLAPEAPYPAALDDCYRVLEYVAAEASALRLDTDRIAVAGTSAGGTLAAALALLARDRGGPTLSLQLLVNPALDDRLHTASMLRYADAPVWDARKSELMWRQYLGGRFGGDVPEYAAPARALDVSGLPPAYIATAEHDSLRDEGILYAMRLMDAGVPVELHNWPGTYHGFGAVGWGTKIAQAAAAEQVRALKAALIRS